MKNLIASFVLFTFSQAVTAQIDSIQNFEGDTLEIISDTLVVPDDMNDHPIPAENKSDFVKPVRLHSKFNDNTNCIYNLKPAVDIPIAALGVIGTITGFSLIAKKTPSDSATIVNLDPETDIKLGINRKDIHNYDPDLKHISDYFLYGGAAYGLVLLLDHDIRQDAGKIGLLYLETMGITGSSYSLTAAAIDKLRPYAYNKDSIIVDGIKQPEVPLSIQTKSSTRNSFYGGHPSVPAASTLFVARVYSAYHPHSPFRFVFYGLSVAATGTTAYLRYKGGYHFPTDLVIGVALGSAYGLLVPGLHRCKDGSGFSLTLMTGETQGFNLAYTF
ncbi:MAG: phosphatase PAP2 family protein [Chitinophagales bacterium]